MADKLDYWRKFFRSANSNIFQVIEKAILVAACDCADEFDGRRDRIAQTLYTCRLRRCSGCDQSVLRAAPEELEEDDRSNGGEAEAEAEEEENQKVDANINSSCDDATVSNAPDGSNRLASNYSYDEAEALTEEIEEESQTVREVLRIKEILENQEDEPDKVLFECLRRLQLMGLSVETLDATQIGKAVNGLKRHNSKNIRHLVRDLIEGWKVIVDEWMKATAALVETPPESVNPSVVSEDHWHTFPPLDEGALLASQTAPFELSKFFDGIDEDGNPRSNVEFDKVEREPQLENSNPGRKKQVLHPEDKGQMKQEAVTRQPRQIVHSEDNGQMKQEAVTRQPRQVLHPEHNGQMKQEAATRQPRQVLHPEDKGQMKHEAVTRQPKPRDDNSRPPKPHSNLNRQSKPATTDLGPGRPSKPAIEQKTIRDTNAHHRQDFSGIQKARSDTKPQQRQDLAGVQKPKIGNKAHQRHDLAVVPKKHSTNAQDVSNQTDESSVRAKLEIAKRKLHERYQQAENAKKQRTIQVMELHDLPKQVQNQRQPNVRPQNNSRNLFNGRR